MGIVYLICQISTLHFQVGTNMLVDGPRKFVVQFSSHKGHGNRAHRNHARNRDQERVDLVPHVGMDV